MRHPRCHATRIRVYAHHPRRSPPPPPAPSVGLSVEPLRRSLSPVPHRRPGPGVVYSGRVRRGCLAPGPEPVPEPVPGSVPPGAASSIDSTPARRQCYQQSISYAFA
eukprot:scaffold25153_cov68-Phaeocystis_antarctica.AAC.8